MVIKFNPRVSGGFVHHVMRDNNNATNVQSKLNELNLSEQDKHNLVKAIMIATLRDFDCDINQKINDAKDLAAEITIDEMRKL